jgi:GT2 family glycosyltransferase
MKNTIIKGFDVLTHQGLLSFSALLKEMMEHKLGNHFQYSKWIRLRERQNYDFYELQYKPLISICMNICYGDPTFLRDSILSVAGQYYDRWILYIFKQENSPKEITEILAEFSGNQKIKVINLDSMEEADNPPIPNKALLSTTNAAIHYAIGDYVSFLTEGDILAANALLVMAVRLNYRQSDFIYSNEDVISSSGKRIEPYMKPDWSPDTLLSHHYTGQLSLYRLSIAQRLQRNNIMQEYIDLYDFTIQFTEHTNLIDHINRVLYHKRKVNQDKYIKKNRYQLKIVKEELLKRRGIDGEVEFIQETDNYRIVYTHDMSSLTSIIIPSKDNYECLNKCIQSIIKYTKDVNYELIIVDNGSNLENKNKYRELCDEHNYLYIYQPMSFNFSAMCNIGAGYAKGKYLLFLNDDIEVISDGWLSKMVGHGAQSHTGAVGVKLLYPNSDMIQHCGIINLQSGPAHGMAGYRDNQVYYNGCNRMECNCIAVTGACLLISKEKFDIIGGWNESLPIAFNDVELCFRLIALGYFNVVRNDVILFHSESLSRGYDYLDKEKLFRMEKELERLYLLHPEFKNFDPFYSRQLIQNRNNFSLDLERYDVVSGLDASKIKELPDWDTSKDKYELYIRNEVDVICLFGMIFSKEIKYNNLNYKAIILLSDTNEPLYKVRVRGRYMPNLKRRLKYKDNIDFANFEIRIPLKLLDHQQYKIGLYISNRFCNKAKCVITDIKIP